MVKFVGKAIHRGIDEVVFEAYVNKHFDKKTTLFEVAKFFERNKNSMNPLFFTSDYCRSYASKFYDRLVLESSWRRVGFKKHSSFEETVISRFVHNKSNRAFLPQQNIADIWGTSQRMVSSYLKKMIESGYLIIEEKHSYGMRKATTYILGPKGVSLFEKMVMVQKKFYAGLSLIIDREVFESVVQGVKKVTRKVVEALSPHDGVLSLEDFLGPQKSNAP